MFMERLAQIMKEDFKKELPNMPEEQIDAIIKESYKEVEEYKNSHKHGEPSSYDSNSISMHLKKEYDLDLAPKDVEAFYEDIEKRFNKILTEKEKANTLIGVVQSAEMLGDSIKKALDRQ